MNTITITISISVPENAAITVGNGGVSSQPTPLASLEHEDTGWVCPIHHQVKTVPAGVSKSTGKPYSAFLACPERGCNEKPPR